MFHYKPEVESATFYKSLTWIFLRDLTCEYYAFKLIWFHVHYTTCIKRMHNVMVMFVCSMFNLVFCFTECSKSDATVSSIQLCIILYMGVWIWECCRITFNSSGTELKDSQREISSEMDFWLMAVGRTDWSTNWRTD
jgi:hypothetical protein